MANASETGANFLHGLSDFWNRFFKERDQLEAMYKGSEILVGQAYLDLMESVLSVSLRNAPVFSKDFFKLLTIREDLVTERIDGRFEFEVSDLALKSFQFLYNKIFDPTVILEEFVDFSLDLSEKDLILFAKNPFDWDGDGTDQIIPGVAYRTIEVADAEGVISLVRELAFWIPDAKYDDYNLYLNFGYLINRFEPSSESYKALIRGIIRYFVKGPTPNILTSALNVTVGLPVIREDYEILQGVETLSDKIRVTTQVRYYDFQLGTPLRDDILDEQNWASVVGSDNALILNAFDHLSDIFKVYDYVNKSNWWYNLIIPQDLMPDQSRQRRTVTPVLDENKVNNPYGLFYVGDSGAFVGADDTGFVPVGGTPGYPVMPAPYTGSLWRPTYRHRIAYLAFERFLKNHTFIVEFDEFALVSNLVPFERLSVDLNSIVRVGKSAYTYMLVDPDLEFLDRVGITDTVGIIEAEIVPDDEVYEEGSNELIIGFTDTVIGDYYRYDTDEDIIIANPSTPSMPDAIGNTPVCIGGADPTRGVLENTIPATHGDWPVQITIT